MASKRYTPDENLSQMKQTFREIHFLLQMNIFKKAQACQLGH